MNRRPGAPLALVLAAVIALAAFALPEAGQAAEVGLQDPIADDAASGLAAEPEPFPTTVAHLQAQALAGSGALELVRSLAVEVGPRLAGSPGDARAVAWALEAMRDLGLENVRAEPVTVPHWERGEAEGSIVAPYPQPVVLVALGGSVGTPEGGVTAEVVAAEGLDELAALPDEAVTGKIVFLTRRMERHRDGRGYGAAASNRRSGPARAAAKGAVAVLIRSVGTGTHRLAHTGSTRYEEGVRRIPAAALAQADADLLEAQLATEEPVRFRLRLTSRMLPDAESANVVGEVPGRERPEEIVLLAAHLDSWDLGQGAIDDGAGCATVLQAARLIAELPQPPRRTVRVVLYANEEFGLSGARAYAEAHAEAIDRHVLATEADFGAGRVWRFRTAVDPAHLDAAAEFARLLEPLGIEWGGDGARGGADLIPLRLARVPVADLWHDGTHYFDVHHTADDTVDKIDREAIDQNVAAYASLAWWAAERAETVGRGPEPPTRR